MNRPRYEYVLCEQCRRDETFASIEEWERSDWNFCNGDICPDCQRENIRNHRTNQDALRDAAAEQEKA